MFEGSPAQHLRIVLWHIPSEIQRFATVSWQCVTIHKQPVRSDKWYQEGLRGDGEGHKFLGHFLWRVMLFFCWSRGEGLDFRKDNTPKKPQPTSPIKNVPSLTSSSSSSSSSYNFLLLLPLLLLLHHHHHHHHHQHSNHHHHGFSSSSPSSSSSSYPHHDHHP